MRKTTATAWFESADQDPHPGPLPEEREANERQLRRVPIGTTTHEEESRDKVVDVYATKDVDDWLDLPSDAIGMAIQLQGDMAFALVESELASTSSRRSHRPTDVWSKRMPAC